MTLSRISRSFNYDGDDGDTLGSQRIGLKFTQFTQRKKVYLHRRLLDFWAG
jgi:hypothetical protein